MPCEGNSGTNGTDTGMRELGVSSVAFTRWSRRAPPCGPIAAGWDGKVQVMALLMISTLSGCHRDSYAHARGAEPGIVGSLRDQLQIVDSLQVEESPTSQVVTPFVTSDGEGFVVADMSEGEIRRYGRDGRLRWSTGKKGWGPGELQLPAQAVSVGENEYVVVDGKRGILQFTRTPDSVAWRTVSTDLGRSFQSAPLGRGMLLVAGYTGHRSYSRQSPILHVLDLATGTITRSIMPMPGDDILATTALNAGVVAFSRMTDTILVTVGAVDTVFSYLLSGERVSARGFRSEHFQTATVRPGTIPREYWRESFTRHHKVYALSDGRVLLSHVRLWSGEHVWGTIVLDRGGNTLFDELHREPLLAVRGDTLVFASADNPARWYFGVLPRAKL